ncbi:ArsR/SmtB family transcription factor [Paenibacillus medicaginis]|uniref:ArsR/SmtB family transcription factor n=1 Tax=Paenibacillus medicaginis TaxID=1470560 RepID=A0ABV5C2Z1_9BACL
MEPVLRNEEDWNNDCHQPREVLDGIKNKLVDLQTAAEMAEIFKALGDPTRIRLIYALIERELCVHDLCVLLDMGQSAVSHQLRYLRNLRIVKRRKVGKTVFYSLDDTHVEQIFLQTHQHITHQ